MGASTRPIRIRHQARTRMLRVARAETLTPHRRRVVLAGEALDGFTSAAADDHIKPFLPAPPGRSPATTRRFDARAGELTIDFALHGDGPASCWPARARPGQVVGIGGPRGSFLAPDDSDCCLLAGDETALPAIRRRLEDLPAGARAVVLIEIAGAADRRYLPSAASLSVSWLSRDGTAAGSTDLLLRALRALDWPPGDVHDWIAGELGSVRRLREHLIAVRGLDRDRIRASGYRHRGVAASHQSLDG